MKTSIDQRSKDIVTQLLTKAGFTNITNTDQSHDQFYYLDITAEKNGNLYGFELKDRSCAHDRYGDIMCEKQKADKAAEDLKNGTYYKVYVCNLFTDNVVAFSNTLDGEETVKYCPNTTSFGDRGYSYKSMWNLPQQTVFKYDESMTFTKL